MWQDEKYIGNKDITDGMINLLGEEWGYECKRGSESNYSFKIKFVRQCTERGNISGILSMAIWQLIMWIKPEILLKYINGDFLYDLFFLSLFFFSFFLGIDNI